MRPARTVLEQLIRERRQTFEEFTEYVETYARRQGEAGTLGSRHLQRLAAGQGPKGAPLGPVRPATARLLEHIFGVPIETLLSPPNVTSAATRESELHQRLRASNRLGADMLELARDQLTGLRRLDGQLGAVVGYREAADKATQWESLFHHCLNPTIRTQLGELLSELHTLAGWQALDLAKTQQAWKHYERAKDFSHESTNPSYRAYAAAEQSFVLLDLGEPNWAVQLLDQATREARTAVPPIVRAWLTAAQGEAFAANHQPHESARSFDVAHSLLPTDSDTLTGPYIGLDEHHLIRWQGHALTTTDPAAAIPALQSALNHTTHTSTRARAALHADLTTAYTTLDAPDQAATHRAQAHHLATQIGSQRQIARLFGRSRD